MEELKKVEIILDKESAEDAQLRDKYGSRWNRPASAALNSSMREKIAGYHANLTAAGDSDARLEQRLMQNNAAFSALSIDAAVAHMPRLQVGWGLCASPALRRLWLFCACVATSGRMGLCTSLPVGRLYAVHGVRL